MVVVVINVCRENCVGRARVSPLALRVGIGAFFVAWTLSEILSSVVLVMAFAQLIKSVTTEYVVLSVLLD